MPAPDLEAIKIAAANGDSVIDTLKWIGGFGMTLLVIALPIMNYVRKYSMDKAANSKDEAASTLYEQLQRRLQDNEKDIRELIKEKNKYFEECATLRYKVEKLTEYENTIESMKKRLDAKDTLLAEANIENRKLLREIIDLKERISDLEKQQLSAQKSDAAGKG